MAAFGFSLNSLSLFGLVLAIGIVVDDAIVVVENAERTSRRASALAEATIKAMEQVGGALIAIALVLSAVFIPTAFISGISGQFYRQFALTIAVATIFSAFVSLTLSPALVPPSSSSRMGRSAIGLPAPGILPFGWFFRLFNRAFTFSSDVYGKMVGVFTRRSIIVLLLHLGLLALTVFGFTKVPAGFIPPQDQGYFIVVVQLPEGASLSRTDAIVQKISRLALEVPGIVNVVAFAGFDGATSTNAPNKAALFPCLSTFEERSKEGLTAAGILANLREKLASVDGAFVLVLFPRLRSEAWEISAVSA